MGFGNCHGHFTSFPTIEFISNFDFQYLSSIASEENSPRLSQSHLTVPEA